MPLHYLSYPAQQPPAGASVHGESPHVLFVFIPGNPGLIDYYEPHLAHLRSLVDKWSSPSNNKNTPLIHIYGQDQDGFNTESCSTDDQGAGGPFNVEHQIDVVVSRIRELLNPAHNPLSPKQDDSNNDASPIRPFTHVILSGHSMGAYMSMQIAQRQHRDPTLLLPPTTSTPTSSSSPLTSSILLFPTISHIAASPNGTFLSKIRRIPFLEKTLAPSFLNHVLPRILPPITAINYLASTLASLPPHAANTFTSWIRSGYLNASSFSNNKDDRRPVSGLWQTLYMAFDELDVIADEPWDEDLWGDDDEDDGKQPSLPPKFCFYYGSDDPWVSNSHRDAFIRARLDGGGGDDSKKEKGRRVRIMVDDEGLPHAYCIEIRHSEIVANKIDGFLREIYGVQQQ